MNLFPVKVDVKEVPVISPQQRTLLMGIRQALLMMVDAIEVYIGTEIRTAELRKNRR